MVAAPRKDGASPLFIAAQSGYAECARILLEAGAEVDQARLVRFFDIGPFMIPRHLDIWQTLSAHTFYTVSRLFCGCGRTSTLMAIGLDILRGKSISSLSEEVVTKQ